jgi:hypothetical protein
MEDHSPRSWSDHAWPSSTNTAMELGQQCDATGYAQHRCDTTSYSNFNLHDRCQCVAKCRARCPATTLTEANKRRVSGYWSTGAGPDVRLASDRHWASQGHRRRADPGGWSTGRRHGPCCAMSDSSVRSILKKVPDLRKISRTNFDNVKNKAPIYAA